MRKIKKLGAIFAFAIFFSIFAQNFDAHAIQQTELEPNFVASETIEINEAGEGYDFDVTLLDNNLEATYTTTVTNDSEKAIKIDSIDFHTSDYKFLEYDYDGISEGDEIASGESKVLTIKVSSNDKETQTVSEDYSLKVNYSEIDDPIDPDDPDTPEDQDTPEDPSDEEENPETISIKPNTIIALFVFTFVGGFLLVAKNVRRRNFVLIFALPLTGILLLSTAVYAEGDESFEIKGKVNFVNIYTVTIDPNGGIYNNSSEKVIGKYREGETVHVGEVTREHFTFQGWEVNPGELDSNNDIKIHNDTLIKAKWNEKTYLLTVKPNGGKYKGSEQQYQESFRPNETAQIETPTYTGHDFIGWTIEEDGTSFTGDSIPMNKNVTLVANYKLQEYTVTINPNGGKYNGSEQIYSTTVNYGDTVNLSGTTWEDHEITHWTQNGTEISKDSTEVQILEDTDFVAYWQSSLFYTVTIVPNGGTYDGSTASSQYTVRKGESYNMLEATRDDGYALDYWTDDESNHFNEESFIVEHDITLTAHWFKIVARIERTGKLYPSIMSAHEEANPGNITGDTITLLIDTEEIITNTKQITLDLNNHTVTGYLDNTTSGDITLINGEINNPNGPAAINNGTLTMGIDDYQDNELHQKAANILRDNIRLIGTEIGLQQNNIFNFYDGFIEGNIGLVGGYNDSPWFRDTFDGVVINYYPVVSHNMEKDCQHVELGGSDRAVSKTTQNGEIYYYNLQDNIDTSAITNYDISIVRNFEATYPLENPANITTNIDTAGFDVQFGDDLIVNGTLNLTNSLKDTHVSELSFARTIDNNSNLNISDVTMEAISGNPLIDNGGNLDLKNSTLKSSTAHVIVATSDNASITSDNQSEIVADSTNKYALLNQASNLSLNGGNFTSSCTAIVNDDDKTMTITNAKVTSVASSSNSCAAVENRENMTIENIDITVDGDERYAIGVKNYKNLTFNNGDIAVNSNYPKNNNNSYWVAGINNDYKGNYGTGATNINGGNITATSNSYAYGIKDHRINTSETKNSPLVISATGYRAYGIKGNNVSIAGGSITANAIDDAYGIDAITLSSMSAGNVEATSTSGNAYGFYANSTNSNRTNTISGGTIRATTDADNKVAYGINNSADTDDAITITGGDIYGGTYGIYDNQTSINYPLTIGNIEPPIYNGVDKDEDDNILPALPVISGGVHGVNGNYIYFYDGLVRGNNNHFNDMTTIKATPSGTTYAYGESGEYEHAIWLTTASNYLHVVGGSDYNSLDEAYANVPDGGTIEVIKDFATEAVLPSNTKNITLDLKGHTLTYTQPLLNQADLTITDSSTAKTGTIINTNPSVSTISSTYLDQNHVAKLKIESGNIIGACNAIHIEGYSYYSDKKGTFESTGGTFSTLAQKSDCSVVNLESAIATMTNTNILGSTEANYTIDGVKMRTASTLTFNSGAINIKALYAYDINTTSFNTENIIINGGDLSAESCTDKSGCKAYVVYGNSYTHTIINETNSQTTTLSAEAYEAKGVSSGADTTLNAGTITVSGKNSAQGITSNQTYINGGKIDVVSQSGNAIGVGQKNNPNGQSLTMTGGQIISHKPATNTTGVAYGVDTGTSTITGGSIHGDNYGINSYNSSNSRSTTLGINDSDYHNGTDGQDPQPYISGDIYAINNGYINFYDGMLHGETNYVSAPENIKAIPTSATYARANETDAGWKDCWLIEATEYLRLMRKNTSDEYEEISRHNSLTDAFSAAQDSDIVQVIEDYATEATHEANTKNVTLDLNGHSLIYTQPILNDSTGTLTIKDSSTTQTGSVTNTNISAEKPTIKNEGALIINSGSISSVNRAITNSKNTTINGGKISTTGGTGYEAAAIYTTDTLTVNGGTITAINPSSNSAIYAIRQSSGKSNINGGEIYAEGKNTTYGIGGGSSPTATMTGGSIASKSSGSTAYGINSYYTKVLKSDTVTAQPTITVTAYNDAHGVHGSYTQATVETGIIDVTSTTNSATGVSGAGTVSGCAITVKARSEAKGVTGYQQDFSNTTINATSTSGNAYGINITNYGNSHYYSNIHSGNVSAVAETAGKVGAGIHVEGNDSVTVEAGTFYGSSYGLQAETPASGRTITLGKDDSVYHNGHNDTLELILRGGVYGIRNGNVNFYDGQVQGVDAAYFDRNIKNIAANSDVYAETATVNDVEYQVRYVAPDRDMVRIGSHPYPSIAEALKNASAGDTITLLEDNYVFYPFNVEAGKDVTIELDGNTIITGNQFVNSGKIKFQNTNPDTDSVIIDYHEGSCAFKNNTNATLEIDNVDVTAYCVLESAADSTATIKNSALNFYAYNTNSNYLIENKGDLTISNSTATTPYSVIRSYTGVLTINSSTIESNGNGNYSYEAITVYGGSANISNSTIRNNNMDAMYGNKRIYTQLSSESSTISSSNLTGALYISKGKLTTTGSKITCLSTKAIRCIEALANTTTTFSNTELNLQPYYNDSTDTRDGSISNRGNMTFSNGSKINIAASNSTVRMIANYNTLTLDNSSINYDSSDIATDGSTKQGLYVYAGSAYIQNGSTINVKSTSNSTAYGIYINDSSTEDGKGVVFTDSTVTAEGAKTSYGVYLNNGNFTMGVKETDPSKIGQDIADKNMPLIKGIGTTTGIGIKKNTGSFYFYDGRLIGNTAAKPEIATSTEYLYETKEELNAEDGNYHCILDWIRQTDGS